MLKLDELKCSIKWAMIGYIDGLTRYWWMNIDIRMINNLFFSCFL